MKLFIPSAAGLLVALLFASCTRSYPCDDAQLQPAFVGFKPADIDTLVLRKFRPGTNFQTLIDTFVVRYSSGYYNTSHDTTTVFVPDYERGIKAGYDWQLVIPAKRRTVRITAITGEKKSEQCTFSMDPRSCTCANNLFSAEVDAQLVDFSGNYFGDYRLFIK